MTNCDYCNHIMALHEWVKSGYIKCKVPDCDCMAMHTKLKRYSIFKRKDTITIKDNIQNKIIDVIKK